MYNTTWNYCLVKSNNINKKTKLFKSINLLNSLKLKKIYPQKFEEILMIMLTSLDNFKI